jgi:hypothetical protein
MLFWLLNTFSTPVLALIVVGGLMAIAGAGLAYVRRRWPHFITGEHNDVAGILLGVVGATYGIMLAFVVVAVYQAFTDAEENVRTEASEVVQIYLDTRGLDIAGAVSAQVTTYVRDVVLDEWPSMANGRSSPRAEADIHAMFGLLQGYEPRTQAQVAFYTAAIADLNGVIAARRARLFDAQEELPAVLEFLLFGGAVLVVAFTWLFGMRRFRAQLVMVLGVAALIGFSLLVTLVIDHPFSGDVTVSSGPFTQGILGTLTGL